MLDNLVGPEGLASEKLVCDVRSLCSLAPEDLNDVAKVFSQLGKTIVSEKNKFLKAIEKNVKGLQKDRELLRNIPEVSAFILERWARYNLTREKIVDDLIGVGLAEEQKENLAPLLAAMEENAASVRQELLEQTALATGVPIMTNVLCSSDARAVFQEYKYHEEKGNDQPYFVLDHFVPVAILELVSELNEEQTNHSFLLTEENLKNMCNILQRAQTRLERVKAALRKSSYLKD